MCVVATKDFSRRKESNSLRMRGKESSWRAIGGGRDGVSGLSESSSKENEGENMDGSWTFFSGWLRRGSWALVGV